MNLFNLVNLGPQLFPKCVFSQVNLNRQSLPELALGEKECLELWCGMLQIVLSHHFQKPEIINMLANSLQTKQACDFTTVRDTMYKYSKKAEDKFFD